MNQASSCVVITIAVLYALCVSSSILTLYGSFRFKPHTLISVNEKTPDTVMHWVCNGTGETLVILDAGLPFTSASFSRVLISSKLTQLDARICAFDRPGYGLSSLPNDPDSRTSMDVARDVYDAIQHSGDMAGKPIIYVGWSYGGFDALSFASLYGDTLTGIVLMDSTTPQQCTNETFLTSLEEGISSFLITTYLYPLGLMGLMGITTTLPAEAGAPSKLQDSEAFWRTIYYVNKMSFSITAYNELKQFKETAKVVTKIFEQGLGDIPIVHVVSNSYHDEAIFKDLSNNYVVLQTQSDHYIPYNNPNVVFDAIDSVLEGFATFKKGK